jgi:hypothetical protein
MDNYDDYNGGQEARPGWFKRNWLWFVPVIVLLPIICCCGGIFGTMWFGVSQLQGLPPYVDSVAAAEQNDEVQQALGTPIELGGFMGIPTDGSQVDIQYNTGGATFIGNIPITGPNGDASIYVEANSPDSVNWTYTVQEVTLPDGTVVDLIPADAETEDQPETP